MARGAGGVQLNRVQGVMGMEMENGLGLAKPRTPQSTEHPSEPPQLGGHPEMGLDPQEEAGTPQGIPSSCPSASGHRQG